MARVRFSIESSDVSPFLREFIRQEQIFRKGVNELFADARALRVLYTAAYSGGLNRPEQTKEEKIRPTAYIIHDNEALAMTIMAMS